jgi:hypothetical protein
MIVHILHRGSTFCGFGRGQFPGEWSSDHKWTHLTDIENVTCSECLEVAAKAVEKELKVLAGDGV